MNPIIKFRYISFIGRAKEGSSFFRQTRYLDRHYNSKYCSILRQILYRDIQDFYRKYKKSLTIL